MKVINGIVQSDWCMWFPSRQKLPAPSDLNFEKNSITNRVKSWFHRLPSVFQMKPHRNDIELGHIKNRIAYHNNKGNEDEKFSRQKQKTASKR
jgi:hypothetical protein